MPIKNRHHEENRSNLESSGDGGTMHEGQGRMAAFHQAAVVQMENAIYMRDQAGIMSDHQNRGAGVMGGATQKIDDLFAVFPVKGGGRFIRENKGWFFD